MHSPLSRVIATFHASLGQTHRTQLLGGFAEPEYIPQRAHRSAEIRFREDFLSSALHEVSHWCIAGEGRRQQHDFGYWYEQDGRSAEFQLEFEKAEVCPQALEWIFSTACGQQFHLSRDNHGPEGQQSDFDFASAVVAQARKFCRAGLPKRAEIFASALAEEFAKPQYANEENYSEGLVR